MDTKQLEPLKISGGHSEVLVPPGVNAVLDLMEYTVHVENQEGDRWWIDVYQKDTARRVGAFPREDAGCYPQHFEDEAVDPFVEWVLDGCPTMEGVS